MAKQSKGQKYGRNRDRNPSSRLQKMRTEKNKRVRAERHGTPLGIIPNYGAKKMVKPIERMTFSGQVPEYRVWTEDDDGHRYVLRMPHLVIKDGVTTDVIRA
jgi:hypothetical protein